MSIALTGKDDLLVGKARDLLADEGARDVSHVRLDDLLDGRSDVAGADTLFLLTREQELDKVGGWASQINPEKGRVRRLVLCMPRPNARASGLLLKHADRIISPAGSSVEHFVERVLGLLIQEKRIEPYDCGEMFGATRRMREVYRDIEKYARLKETVLILGETGTGKRLVAEALHKRSPRGGPLVHVDFGALKPEVIETELFGALRGAYTGALANRVGLIEEADCGTAFMDEIGELSLDMQAKLLKVIEEKKLRPVGASKYLPVDVWFVFATNRDLREAVEGRSFRRDLFARINRIVLQLPPLRERKADIPLLVENFVEKFNRQYETNVEVEPGALDELFCLDWPENVRDLDNVIVRAAANVGSDGIITDTLLRESLKLAGGYGGVSGQAAADGPYKTIIFRPREDKWPALKERAEAAYLRAIIEVAKSPAEAVEMSGMGRAQFYDKLKKYGLSFNS